MLNPQTIRGDAPQLLINSSQASSTLRQYTILACQNEWVRTTNKTLADYQPRVKRRDCPLQAAPAAHRLENNIERWFFTIHNDRGAAINQFGNELEYYWSRLPGDLPAEISANTQRAEWARLARFRTQHEQAHPEWGPAFMAHRCAVATFFYHKRLQLIAAFAMAERAACSTTVEQILDAFPGAFSSNMVQRLVREMQTDQRLVQLCDWVASGAARLGEEEEFISYIPNLNQQGREPGRTNTSMRMRIERAEMKAAESERKSMEEAQEQAGQEVRDKLFLTQDSKEVTSNGEESLWYGLEKAELE